MRMHFKREARSAERIGILATLPHSAQRLLTHKGKTAIHLGGRALGIRAGERVLVPAYNCGSEIDPLLHLGVDAVMYDVDPRVPVTAEDIVPFLEPRVRAVYVTHYWGFVQPLGELRKVCDTSGIALIEDAALSLCSRGSEGPVGSAGDVSVFSFSKSLPVPDGGALVMNRGTVAPFAQLKGPRFGAVLKEMLPLVRPRAAWADRLSRSLRRGLARDLPEGDSRTLEGLPDMPASYYFSEEVGRKGLSRLSQWLLGRFDASAMVDQRRANYTSLAEAVADIPGLTPVFGKLPDGTCPLVFPLLVKNRDEVCAELNRRRIAAIPWWAGYHQRLDWRGFPKARFFKDHVVALPIHQQVNGDGCRYMAETLGDLVASGRLRPAAPPYREPQ